MRLSRVEKTDWEESLYTRSLIEASLDPLVTISTEGKIMDMNVALENITGVTRQQLTGTDFLDYFTEPEKAREVYQDVFANGSVADSPLTLRHINGKLTDVLFNGSVYKDGQGKVLGVVIVARDVTMQKRIAGELTQAKNLAEIAQVKAEEAQKKAEKATQLANNAVKSKQQFLSNMSHEIRTPMNAIIGFTKVALKTELSAKQTEYLTAIKTSGDALIVLINDILDLAKVDAGKMEFEEIPFRLNSSLSSMLHLFEPRIQEKNLELIKFYDQKIPEVLLGDPVRLHQIILNLLSNAVKFTSHGKITMSTYLHREDEETATVEMAVSDTGIGIAEDKIDAIFENFQQATSETSRVYGGTGLGLAIVKQLVEAQHGSITVKSRVNEGSSFSVLLSFRKTSAEIEIGEEDELLVEEVKHRKILVVEDMALNQLLMRTLLEDFDFECDIAPNGKIAIEKLQTNTYDLILMDIQMPVMNGFETTTFIRDTMRLKIPIIALTADVTTADLKKCKAVGMDDYIAKPVDERLLYYKLVGLLKNAGPVTEKSHQNQQTKLINLHFLNHKTKSKPRLMIEMISLYLGQTATLRKALKQQTEEGNWSQVQAIAHKMIPSFSIIGIKNVYQDIAVRIQDQAGLLEKTEEIPGLVRELDDILAQACEELEEELRALSADTNNVKDKKPS